jgi:hypothetical protein
MDALVVEASELPAHGQCPYCVHCSCKNTKKTRPQTMRMPKCGKNVKIFERKMEWRFKNLLHGTKVSRIREWHKTQINVARTHCHVIVDKISKRIVKLLIPLISKKNHQCKHVTNMAKEKQGYLIQI